MVEFPLGLEAVKGLQVLLEDVDVGQEEGLAISSHDAHELHLVVHLF